MHLRILGIRGIPAAHGGFETFAEHLAIYLKRRGWKITVYCQEDGEGPVIEDEWSGINRIRIPVNIEGPKGTMLFDWLCIKHASKTKDLILTLGYNTAFFCFYLRLLGIPNVINMDGIEWKRKKWGAFAKFWFYLNDWAGCWIGTHLIADHPQIKKHLASRVPESKITMIPYGADPIETAPLEPVYAFGLEPSKFITVIARPEPENSLLEIVEGFSSKVRGVNLVVLGNYEPDKHEYHKAVMDAASDEVKFVGAIYEPKVVSALRYHSIAYVHGHQVGGTNPSLVEALGAGNAIIAQDNLFNRWVAGDAAFYFEGAKECSAAFDDLLRSDDQLRKLRMESRKRFSERFRWEQVLGEYEVLLKKYLPEGKPVQVPSG